MDELWFRLIHLLWITKLCNCLPVNLQQSVEAFGAAGVSWQWTSGLVTLTIAVCAILFIIGCMCCHHHKGFQEFTNASPSTGNLADDSITHNSIEPGGNDPGLVNPIAAIANSGNGSEFTIFRPLSPSHHNYNVITTSPQITLNRPTLGAKRITEADFQSSDDVNHWFDESNVNFPRNKLKYVNELGRGWFGRVIAGEAAVLSENDDTSIPRTTPVVVRVLDAAAAPREQATFLRDARIYYRTSHPNIMQLHGKSVDVPPLLLIQPFYANGDLKRYLRQNPHSNERIFLLRLCWQLTDALEYLYHKNISHPDLALRNCQLSDKMSLCLGDYGLGPQQYPEDYYPGSPPISVRWCAPENVICTQETIQPKIVTCVGNVWSLGVVLWEIISLAKQPYAQLSDDDVVSYVLEKMQATLDEPDTQLPYTHNIYQLSRLCCSSLETRPPIVQVHSMLSILLQSNETFDENGSNNTEPVSDSEFLTRWNSLKPNTIVKTDNHTPEHNSSSSTTISHPLQIDTTNSTSSVSDKTQLSINTAIHYDAKQLSPASTINSDCFIAEMSQRNEKSLSLTNLHGSLENLVAANEENVVNISKTETNPFLSERINEEHYESWLENVASENKEDLSYVKGLSQAIQELDSALALEKSSSSSDTSHQPSPGPESIQNDTGTHPKIDFKLGPIDKPPSVTEVRRIMASNEQPDSLFDSIFQVHSSGSETEDETWKKRIERGAYSEKVRIKSKSVADLMVLTHIDTDTDSETPLPSLDGKTNRSLRANLESMNKAFGSEGNLNAVHDTFQQELKKLQEARRDSLLFVPVPQHESHSCDQPTNVPSLNIIHASAEDLRIKQDLDFPPHIFLQKKSDFIINTVPNFNIIEASREDLSNLDDLDIPRNVFIHKSGKPVFFKFKNTSHVDDVDTDDDDNNNVEQPIGATFTFDVDEESPSCSQSTVINTSQKDITTNVNTSKESLIEEEIITDLVQDCPITSTPIKCEPKSEVFEKMSEIRETTFLDDEINKTYNLPDIVHKEIDINQSSTSVSDQQNITSDAYLPDLINEKLDDNLIQETNKTFILNDNIGNKTFNINNNLDKTHVIDKSNLNVTHNIDQLNQTVTIVNHLENAQNNQELNKNESNTNCTNDICRNVDDNLIDLAQTVTNLADSLECPIPKKPPEFNVMRFEVIPKYNFQNSVILGPCDDYTLDLYSGLKTFTDDDPVDEELYQFSTNFTALNAEIKSNECGDMFLNKVPPLTPDLSSIVTPCDSLEEHAINTTIALKTEAENIINNIIADAEKIVRGKLSKDNKYSEFVPEIRNIIDEIIFKAECFVTDKLQHLDGNETPQQMDSLEYTTTSIQDTQSLNKTVIINKPNETDISTFDSTYTLNDDENKDGYSLELGWFLHSNTNLDMAECNDEMVQGNLDDVDSPPTSDNSYVGFSLDEECVAALRNELAAKLPHAQGPAIEPPELSASVHDNWECEPGTSTAEQHDEVILRYNVFAVPLSPIAEESEEFDCPTPEITPCRDDSDSDCEWSGACYDGNDTDTRTPHAGSPNAAGRRSSRHRHTPSMDSCCSNDTLFNIEDLNGVIGENCTADVVVVQQKEIIVNENELIAKSPTQSDKLDEQTMHEYSKTTVLIESHNTDEKTSSQDVSDVYPTSSTEPNEAEPSTREINSDYFSPTRNDFLSQQEQPSSCTVEFNNSLKHNENDLKKSVKNSDVCLNNEINSIISDQLINCQENGDIFDDLASSENINETYTITDILEHLEDTPPVKLTPPQFPIPSKSDETTTDGDFLELKFDFKDSNNSAKSLKSIVYDYILANNFLLNSLKNGDSTNDGKQLLENFIEICQNKKYIATMSHDKQTDNNEIEIDLKIKQNAFLNNENKNDTIQNLEMAQAMTDKLNVNEIDDQIDDDVDPMYANVNYCVNTNESELIKRSSNYNSFDDDSVIQFYENIPTSPVHDDKIIESLYENIDKVNNKENIDKIFAGNTANLYENTKNETQPSYHKLYENIEKSEDFPYEHKFDKSENGEENSQSENQNNSDELYDKIYAGSEDLYSDITDIRFSGPGDAQLMSTSFSDPHGGGSDDQDWDSGSETRSSSSGEFVWKEGEHEASVRVLQAPSEKDEKQLRSDDDLSASFKVKNCSDLSSADEGGSTSSEEDAEEGLEFIPSAWDSQAAPAKSAMRSPNKTIENCERKRGVSFKKQKYHCVYEYPREPDFSPTEWTSQPYTSSIWGTPTASDLSSFADWELDTENMLDDGSGSISSNTPDFDVDDDLSSRYVRRDYFRRPGDLYRLADVVPDIDFTTGLSVTDDDFYVTSSSKPFQSCSSQFFPGQLQYTSAHQDTNNQCKLTATTNSDRANSIIEFANDLKKLHTNAQQLLADRKIDLTTPDSGVEDVTPASMSDNSPTNTDGGVCSLKQLAEKSLNIKAKSEKAKEIVMGGLRHTRDRLKLDLPPSPTSFSANKAFNLEITDANSLHREQREPPTFTTFGKTRFSIKHVDTPTEELDITKIPFSALSNNSSSIESTADDSNSPDMLQSSECDTILSKRRSIEIVRGEASLLDSADEDSGIESSANATLERKSITIEDKFTD